MSTPAIAPLLKPNWPYQTDRVVMLPYSEKHPDIFPETFWPTIYFRLKEDQLLDTIFPGMHMNHLNTFVAYMGSKAMGRVICCQKRDDAPPKVVGLGWLCEYEQGRASFGFGFFKEAWGYRTHIDLSMMMLHYWFTESDAKVLYGTTLNPVARNYSKRFGFKYVGELPQFFPVGGELKNAHLIVLEKGTFLPYYGAWRQGRG